MVQGVTHEQQNQLREMYKKRLKKEKQIYISKKTGVSVYALSRFKNGKFDLYEYLYFRLRDYLLNS